MQAAPWQSLGENARDRYVFWSMRSSCPDPRFISFILQLQAVGEIYKTCNQLMVLGLYGDSVLAQAD